MYKMKFLGFFLSLLTLLIWSNNSHAHNLSDVTEYKSITPGGTKHKTIDNAIHRYKNHYKSKGIGITGGILKKEGVTMRLKSVYVRPSDSTVIFEYNGKQKYKNLSKEAYDIFTTYPDKEAHLNACTTAGELIKHPYVARIIFDYDFGYGYGYEFELLKTECNLKQ